MRLAELLGKGGEGSVFAVEGQPSLAAKVYHQSPLPSDRLEKLAAMISCRSPALEAISAWPQTLLYQKSPANPCGLLMPRIHGSRPLHELYGTSNRRRHFPEAQWHHLLLAARNVAAAFETLHAAGVIVGDVNQGNLLVDRQMCVRFIDCDSFQIAHLGKVFPCPVGTPHFTPPELQSKKLRETTRTATHDRFGLAVLLFHLLFVGRHPFAGRFYGMGELHIEKAIAERRFAFSRERAATLVEPPPASLLLDDLPPTIAELFEQAFRGPDDQRPAARQWVHQLETLLRQRKTCSADATHVYFTQLNECPWCRIEDEGGPAFFTSDGSATEIPTERLDHLEEKLARLTVPAFPRLEREFKIPQPLRPGRPNTRRKIATPDVAAALLAVSVMLCLLAATTPWMLPAGALAAFGGGGWLLLGREARSRRAKVIELSKRLEQMQSQLHSVAQTVRTNHRHRHEAFERSLADLKAKCEHYYAADTRLEDVLVIQRAAELNRFLSRHLIQEQIRHIPSLTYSLASVLQSYGVESAADIDSLKLINVPMLTPGVTMELIDWREELARQFEFKSEHGLTLRDASTAGDAAVRRFKVVQARTILIDAKQLGSVASAAAAQLAKEVARYDQVASQAMGVAVELRNHQSRRFRLERWLNDSPAVIVPTALGGPAFGLVLRTLFGNY